MSIYTLTIFSALFALLPSLLYCQTLPLYENGRFEYADGYTIPATDTWTAAGVEVVDGSIFTFQALSPQTTTASVNNPSQLLAAPVYRLNRLRLDNTPHLSSGRGGDTLMSRPIPITTTEKFTLSFAYERTGLPPGGTYNRTWASSLLVGPEPRVIRDNNPHDVVAEPDNLILEIAVTTSTDAVPEYLWRRHARMDDSGEFITDNPAFTLFGAGGYLRGFHETITDSALTSGEGLRSDVYDDGKDQYFHPVILPIPLTSLTAGIAQAEQLYLFFRFRVEAVDNGTEKLPDDADNFYLDNIQLYQQNDSRADITILSAGINTPYTIVPRHKIVDLPVYAYVANLSSLISPSFVIRTEIKPDIPGIDRSLIYSRTQTIPFLPGRSNVRINFPTLNITFLNSQFGLLDRDSMIYTITTVLQHTNPDINPLNDTIRTKFTMHFGDVLAYDPPVPGGKNDAPDAAGALGKGLNLTGRSIGDGTWRDWQFGADGGNGSGRIAVRFTLSIGDTITGYQAYFASINNGNNVRFVLYPEDGTTGTPSTSAIEGSFIIRKPGYDDLRYPEKGIPIFNEYTTYLLPAPIALQAGNYWLSIAQTDTEGFELGASASRMGMVTTNVSTEVQPGDKNISLMADEAFRINTPNSPRSNTNTFMYSNNIPWIPFMPTSGNPGYAYLDAQGTVDGTSTWSRGTWIPMLRLYFGPGKTTTSVEPQEVLSGSLLGQAIPNPASVSTTIRFSVPAAGFTRLSLLNSLGTEVARPVDSFLPAGEQTIETDARFLPAGVYFYRLEIQGHTFVRQIVVLH